MKKVCIAYLVVFGLIQICYAGRNFTILSDIGPSISTGDVTIAAPQSGAYNCITDVVVMSTQAYTFRMLSGNTTNFSVSFGASVGLVKDWNPEDAFCAAQNATLTIKTSTSPYELNYKGFIRK